MLLNEETRNLHRTAELLLEVNRAPPPSAPRSTPGRLSAAGSAKLAEVSGLPVVPAEDLIEATSDCGAYVMVHSALKRRR